MGAVITFTLRDPFPLLNTTLRMHFRKRKQSQRRMMHEIAEVTAGLRPAEPFEHAFVRIERYSVGRPDLDGLYGGAKPLIDCLTTPVHLKPRTVFGKHSVRNPLGLGFVVDDGPKHIRLEVVPMTAKRADQRTVVMIEELGPAELQAA